MPSPAPGGSVGSPADSVAAIRTLALVGPSSSGKTLLAESLLAQAGAITSAGSIERGSTRSDFDPLERKLGHSLATSVLHCRHEGCRIHLLDTPGSTELLGQAMPALEAVETAVLVLNAATASEGLEPAALRMLAWAAERGRDRVIVVNRIDTPGVKLAAVLTQIQAAVGRECLPLNLPVSTSAGVAVVDAFYGREGTSDFGSVADAHRALVEQVVDVDAGFVERYLEQGDVDAAELHAPLEQALREGHLVPVCFTSAKTGAGVAELLDVIVKLLPNPGEANPPDFLKGEGDAAHPIEARPDPAAHVIAHVWKVTNDPYVGRLAMVRVHQGTLTRDSQLYIGDARKPFRVGHLFMLQGKEHIEISRALPGDLCAIAKVDELHFDAVLHDAADDDHLHLKPLPLPVPVHGLALAPKRHGDEQRMADILARLCDEDPCLRVERGAANGAAHGTAHTDTVVYGLGERHLALLLERLRETHRFEVETRPPRIAYRETIQASAEGHHRHKKQTGGAGQFGEVFLRVEPLARGAGIEFVDVVKGGAIPSNFMPAVEKGVREALAAGAIAGFAVVDVRITVHDGKHHSVDSKEIAFVTAARRATWVALREARPVVLEPVVEVEVTVPAETVGDITGDLTSRRGMVTGTANAQAGSAATLLTVRGQAPLAELASYQQRLNALTRGEGRYTLAPSHLAAVPASVQAQLVAAWQRHDQDD
jgi:elongation factor G